MSRDIRKAQRRRKRSMTYFQLIEIINRVLPVKQPAFLHNRGHRDQVEPAITFKARGGWFDVYPESREIFYSYVVTPECEVFKKKLWRHVGDVKMQKPISDRIQQILSHIADSIDRHGDLYLLGEVYEHSYNPPIAVRFEYEGDGYSYDVIPTEPLRVIFSSRSSAEWNTRNAQKLTTDLQEIYRREWGAL
jgi:hypothetical protein